MSKNSNLPESQAVGRNKHSLQDMGERCDQMKSFRDKGCLEESHAPTHINVMSYVDLFVKSQAMMKQSVTGLLQLTIDLQGKIYTNVLVPYFLFFDGIFKTMLLFCKPAN